MPPIKEFPAFTGIMKFILGNLVEIFGEELEILIKNQDNVFYYSEVITLETWSKLLNFEANPSYFFSDGVHPSKLTYQSWTKYFAEYLFRNELIMSRLLKLKRDAFNTSLLNLSNLLQNIFKSCCCENIPRCCCRSENFVIHVHYATRT
jgi:hypothetical protein